MRACISSCRQSCRAFHARRHASGYPDVRLGTTIAQSRTTHLDPYSAALCTKLRHSVTVGARSFAQKQSIQHSASVLLCLIAMLKLLYALRGATHQGLYGEGRLPSAAEPARSNSHTADAPLENIVQRLAMLMRMTAQSVPAFGIQARASATQARLPGLASQHGTRNTMEACIVLAAAVISVTRAWRTATRDRQPRTQACTDTSINSEADCLMPSAHHGVALGLRIPTTMKLG